jgi:hypothetical protein
MYGQFFGKKARIILALGGSYCATLFLMQFFFVGYTPNLNPNAFTLLNDKLHDLQMNVKLSTTQIIPTAYPTPFPEITPTIEPIPQATAVPTTIPTPYVPPTNAPPPVRPSQPPLSIPTPTRIPTQPPRATPTNTPTNPPVPTKPQTTATYAQFGQCLNASGMTMYMSATCGLCSQQKKTLKDAANYVRMVDCNISQENGLECSNAGVRGLPTWGKNGKSVLVGPQSLEDLAKVSSCTAPQ